MLAVAAGEPIRTIASRLECDRATVWRVCRRYEQGGLKELLLDDPRLGRPLEISPPPATDRLSSPATTFRPVGPCQSGRREAAGLTQEEIGHRAGLSRNYVGMLERGERAPTIVALRQLALALGTTMSSLVQELEAELAGPRSGRQPRGRQT